MTTVILTGHGSRDPRSSANAAAIAGHLGRLAPEWEVRVAFCEHSSPNLRDALRTATGDVVVAPFLLASAYHARIDIPALIGDSGVSVRQTATLGEDDRLLHVMGERLTQAGVSRFDHELGVLVVAVGSSNTTANTKTATIASRLSHGTRWAAVEVGFATGPTPSVAEAAERLRGRGATRLVIAPWFLAPGRITDRVAEYARREDIPMAEPLGAHRLVAATMLDRVEDTLTLPGVNAA